MRNAGLKLLAFAAAGLLAGCATHQQGVRPEPGRTSRPAARPAPAVAMSNASYVARASAIDLFEIRSSELALQRSSNGRVREFAQMMISAHKGTSAQLSLAGRRLNLLPSAVLDPQHQAMLDALRASGNFDGLYRQQQLQVHRDALALHSAYAARGTSPTLRPVAAAAVPVIQRHLRLLGYL